MPSMKTNPARPGARAAGVRAGVRRGADGGPWLPRLPLPRSGPNSMVPDRNRDPALAQVRPVAPPIPETGGSTQVFNHLFAYQSYGSSTLYEKALLQQIPAVNGLINQSTLSERDVSGYQLGLAPWSQAPLALQARGAAQRGASQTVILKPGQVWRPHGKPGRDGSSFSHLTYGLPYGWLGGGRVSLFIFNTSDAGVLWPTDKEVMFHQFRIPIVQLLAALTATNPAVRKNWPISFPWANAVSGSSSIVQAGTPVVSVRPTKTVLRLRNANLGAALDTRFVLRGINDLDVGSDGLTTVNTSPTVVDGPTFPTNPAAWAFNAGFPAVELGEDSPITMFGADAGGFAIITTVASTDEFDVIRYGRL